MKVLYIYLKLDDTHQLTSNESNSLTKNDDINEKPEDMSDELGEIKRLILSNINQFCISFTNKIVFHENNDIFVKYIDTLKKEMMIKINFDKAGYSKKMVHDYFGKNYLDYFIIENITDKNDKEELYYKEFLEKRDLIKKFDKDKSFIYKDFSCLFLIELISTEIDIKNIFSNFYYKDTLNTESKFNLYRFIEKLEEDSISVCESCDYEKMKKFVSFVNEAVVFKWHVELQKRIFNEYYYN
jgi:hypothetical protein